MNMTPVLNQMASLFILLALGYIANKTKIMSHASDKLFSKVIFNLAMPSTILSSVINGKVELSGGETAFLILMILLTYALGFVLAAPIGRILRCEKKDRGLYSYMIAFGNVGYMGFPIALSIFGEKSAFYVALFNIPFSLFAFSVGIAMISGKGEKFNLLHYINPAFLAAIVSLVIFLTGFKTPAIVADAVGLLSGMTTPGAMILIGSTLAYIPMKEVFTEWRLYGLTFLKLVITPIVTWLLLKQIISNELMLGVLVIMAGMPIATSATMISMEYGGNERLASKSIFISTLLSAVTVPLIVHFLL